MEFKTKSKLRLLDVNFAEKGGCFDFYKTSNISEGVSNIFFLHLSGGNMQSALRNSSCDSLKVTIMFCVLFCICVLLKN